MDPSSVPALEAGARHSASDLKMLQTMHDHAVALGATCGQQESANPATGPVRLIESAATTEVIVLRESKADYEIKLIAPGKGSTAFYPAEVLKRDGPKVFGAGTHVYLNHPTQAEEAARPEGDVANLAGVLTSAAEYHEAHAKGAGLYARMKVFADHAQMVEEKAPHVGMSIRAFGHAESGAKREGVPVLKELVAAQSVDVVTRAGAGGMILQESAQTAPQQEAQMAENAEYVKLQEAVAAQEATNKRLLERAIRGDARDAGARLLEGVSLPAAAKLRVIESVIGRGVPVKDGELDATKFGEAITAESQEMGRFLSQLDPHRVTGMGTGLPVKIPTAEESTRTHEAGVRLRKDAVKIFESCSMPPEVAKAAAQMFGEDA